MFAFHFSVSSNHSRTATRFGRHSFNSHVNELRLSTVTPFQRHPSSGGCRPIAYPPLSPDPPSFDSFHSSLANRSIGITLRLQVISGTRGGEVTRHRRAATENVSFLFFSFLSCAFTSSPLHPSPLFFLLNSRDAPSAQDVSVRRPLESESAPDFTIARYSGKKKEEKKRNPMRQRRWKRWRSDIFTGFTHRRSLFSAA